LQSSSNVLGSNVATFSADINGDVNGDFIFDPNATVNNTGQNSQNGTDNNLTVNANDSNAANAQINSSVDLSASSGDATVEANTNGGSANTGNASAIINLLNLINSTVSAGQSFVGTINISGNLNGDILLPEDFVNQLLAASGANSSNSLASTGTSNTSLSNSLISDIHNNVTSSAVSGDAKVQGNTAAGNAKTGKADTNVTILNLTGSNVIGKNNLLVFVNVLGTWVGMIVNAPAGSTAASLGGGISDTGDSSTNSLTNSLNSGTELTHSNDFGINNDVKVRAKSGNATVKNNTSAGDATSGDANTAVNILNMTSSKLNLSNWFGVLFINVFGNWTGSFGVNTAAGNTPTTSATAPAQATSNTTEQFVGFARRVTSPSGSGGNDVESNSTDTTLASNDALTESVPVAKKVTQTNVGSSYITPDTKTHASYTLPIIGFGLAGTLLFISERSRFFGRK
jgi:hypothetical protein